MQIPRESFWAGNPNSDGKGRVYVDLEDKGSIAVVDAKTLKVTTTYDLHPVG